MQNEEPGQKVGILEICNLFIGRTAKSLANGMVGTQQMSPNLSHLVQH